MSMCQNEGCSFFHHRVLHCIEKRLNSEAKKLLMNISKELRPKGRKLIKVTDCSGKTFLHYSVQYSNVAMVQYFIRKGCDMNASDNFGQTPLMLAVDNEDLPTVEVFCNHSVDIYVNNSDGKNAFLRSFYLNVDLLGSAHTIQLFGYFTSVKGKQHRILNMFIRQVNNDFWRVKETMMKLLLNVDCTVKLAIVAFCKIELASFLLQNNYTIEFREHKLGLTALHSAIILKKIDNAMLLIERGANIHVKNEAGVTPLMLAVINNDMALTEILLNNNADIFVTCSCGMNTLQRSFYISIDLLKSICRPLFSYFLVADREKDLCILEMITKKANNEFLVNKEVTMKVLLNSDYMVKLAVLASCNIELASFILQNDYPIEFRESKLGFTALHSAIILGNLEVAKLLIEHRANINAIDHDGYTPLHYYTHRLQYVDEKSEVLNAFLKYGTNFYVRDNHEATVVQYLLQRGTKKTVRTVLQSDIDIEASIHPIPLQWLLMGNNNVDIIDLIELCVKIDANQLHPRTNLSPLITEIYRRNVRYVEFLLEHGADVNYTVNDGYSAFFYAAGYSASRKMLNIIELLLQYGADAQIIVSDGKSLIEHLIKRPDKEEYVIKLIVAHLAMLTVVDQSALTESVRNSIGENQIFKNHFDLCTQQLEELKGIVFYGTTTLFNLLCEKEKTLVLYAYNQELIQAFETTMKNMFHLTEYYLNTLKKRMAKACERAKLQKKSATCMEVLTGLGVDKYPIIVYKIIRYLDYRDLHNICQAAANN